MTDATSMLGWHLSGGTAPATEVMMRKSSSVAPSPVSRTFRSWKLQQASSAAIGAALFRAPPLDGIGAKRIETLARRISLCAASAKLTLHTPLGDATRIVYRNIRQCRTPVCVQCNRHRAWKTVRRAASMVGDLLETAPGTRFAFVTLSSRNLPGPSVGEMLSLHESALSRLWRRKKIARAFVGHITGIEIAIRMKAGQWEAGVHSHTLVALDERYFDRTADVYLNQRSIVAEWRKALQVDYNPICHISAIPDSEAVYSGLREVLKYSLAFQHIVVRADTGFSVDPEIAAYLANALYKRRMCRYGGVFAKRRNKANGDGGAS
jgi:hypothetical protein